MFARLRVAVAILEAGAGGEAALLLFLLMVLTVRLRLLGQQAGLRMWGGGGHQRGYYMPGASSSVD